MGNSHCCHGKVSPYTVERSAARAKEVEDKDEGMFHLGLVACNEKGEIMNCNKHMEYVTGFPKSEMVGQSVNIMLPKEFHERHNQYIQNHVSKGMQVQLCYPVLVVYGTCHHSRCLVCVQLMRPGFIRKF